MDYLIDTNILLRSIDPKHSMNPIAINALRILEKKGNKLYILPQNLIEFWNVYTRPKEKNGLGGSVKEAQIEIQQIKSVFILLEDSKKTYQQWEDLVLKYEVKGVNVHDARLVAGMLINDLTHILTFNIKDFKRYQEITVVNPSLL